MDAIYFCGEDFEEALTEWCNEHGIHTALDFKGLFDDAFGGDYCIEELGGYTNRCGEWENAIAADYFDNFKEDVINEFGRGIWSIVEPEAAQMWCES